MQSIRLSELHIYPYLCKYGNLKNSLVAIDETSSISHKFYVSEYFYLYNNKIIAYRLINRKSIYVLKQYRNYKRIMKYIKRRATFSGKIKYVNSLFKKAPEAELKFEDFKEQLDFINFLMEYNV